jgi:hypothetical protein
MPFSPYELVGVEIPDELTAAGNTVLLHLWGSWDDEKWSVNLGDPTFSLLVYGTLRIDPSVSRDQAMEISYAWIISACKARNIIAAAFQYKGSPVKGPRDVQTEFYVEFQIQRS